MRTRGLPNKISVDELFIAKLRGVYQKAILPGVDPMQVNILLVHDFGDKDVKIHARVPVPSASEPIRRRNRLARSVTSKPDFKCINSHLLSLQRARQQDLVSDVEDLIFPA